MNFKQFRDSMQSHITEMLKDVTHLFVVGVDKDLLWNTYLESFPEGTNMKYRERREYDCSACRHFVKTFGNVVKLKDGKITTIWDFDIGHAAFQTVINKMAQFVRRAAITDVFVTSERTHGMDKNHEEHEDGSVMTWHHFYFKLPPTFVVKKGDEGTRRGQFRDSKNVFQRSLEEISQDAVETVLELIAQNSLYKGEEWEAVLKKFLQYHRMYHRLTHDEIKDWYVWEKSLEAGPALSRIRNHSIGVLLTDVTTGVDLDEAVKRYEKIVAPSNYKRPKAIYTKKMIADAEAKLTELGLLESLPRRFAVLDDITVNNILFADRDAAKRLAGSVFDDMAQGVAVNPKSFSKVEEISAEDFVKDVLPTVKRVEVLFENRLVPNRVSLIAPQASNSKTLFKWGNPFSWAYAGNITDSMKERVKAMGGRVDGVLRFSIQWNEEGDNNNDLDAHCIEPGGNEIFYVNKMHVHPSTGMLDVDIIVPTQQARGGVAVENIIWTDTKRMPPGRYQMFVHCFASRGARSGFTAEVEFDGEVHSFSYNKPLRQGERIHVAEVTYTAKEGFSIKELVPSSTASRKAWGLDTNQFYPASVIMYSPNYWDDQKGIGHRHYFFMLNGSVNDELPNGFFNEYLREDLAVHKRVFEALGSRMRVVDAADQLSGLGFSATKRNSVVVKVEGHVNRTLKVNF